MKQKLFDKFAELFSNPTEIKFYFPGPCQSHRRNIPIITEVMYFRALTLGTYGAARKREDRKIHFYSMNLDSFGVVEASLDDLTNKKRIQLGKLSTREESGHLRKKGHPISSGFDMVIREIS